MTKYIARRGSDQDRSCLTVVMAIVSLPCFEGFNSIAIWPDSQNVSFIFILWKYFLILESSWLNSNDLNLYQASSSYGLLSTTAINNVVSTGYVLTLPFFNGCKYVAYQSDMQQVSWFDNINCYLDVCFIKKVGGVNWYDRRPDLLVNHLHSFHVLNMKVFKKFLV